MPVKSFHHPIHGTVRTGCNPPKHAPKVLLRDHLDIAVAAQVLAGTPDIDYSKEAGAAIAKMYLNATLGSCVPAGQAHSSGVFTGNATGTPVLYADQQIESIYVGMSGGVFDPKNPQATDEGCDPETALEWETTNGLLPDGSHKIQGHVGISATSEIEIRFALWAFENVGLAMELPDAWVNPVPESSGFLWDVAGDPDPSNGHWVVGIGTAKLGLRFSTWGMWGTLSWNAIAKYCMPATGGNLYATISQDSLVKAMAKFPNGLNWEQLLAKFGLLPA